MGHSQGKYREIDVIIFAFAENAISLMCFMKAHAESIFNIQRLFFDP